MFSTVIGPSTGKTIKRVFDISFNIKSIHASLKSLT